MATGMAGEGPDIFPETLDDETMRHRDLTMKNGGLTVNTRDLSTETLEI
jgi:hypothetical protein